MTLSREEKRKIAIKRANSLSFETMIRNLKSGNVGANIRYFRKEIAESTQEEFAIDVNVTRTSLAHYETNSREIPIDVLKRIAEYFDISLDILMFRKEYLSKR